MSSENTSVTPPKNPINKQAKDLSRHFPEKEIQMAKKYMKKSQYHYPPGKMEIKTTHLNLVTVMMIKTHKIIKAGKDVEKWEL